MTLQHCHAHDDGTPIHEAQEPSVGELIEGEASHDRGHRRHPHRGPRGLPQRRRRPVDLLRQEQRGRVGQPPTGKSFSVPAASIFEMKGDKIRRVDDYYNLADLLGQLGLQPGAWVPPPAS